MPAADKKKKTKNVAFTGVTAAAASVILIAGSILPTASLAVAAVSGFAVGASRIRSGRISAVCVWLIASVLSLVLSPDRSPAASFLLLFGVYPILKCEFERIKNTVLMYAVKLVYFNCTLAALYFVGFKLFAPEAAVIENQTLIYIAAVVGSNAVFLVYDAVFGGIMNKYYKTILTLGKN